MKKGVERPESKNATILIVDDSKDNLRMLVEILKAHRFNVRPARDGQMALSSARNFPPDLILLDIVMPSPNGYEVCKALKENPRTRHIPVIFISGLDETEDILKAFRVGGVDYITKPFKPPEVIARINTHLSIKELTTQLEQQKQALLFEVAERQKAYNQLERLQKRLKQNNIRLAQRVQEEVRKFKEQQEILIQRSKLEALGELAAGMAHEINQPLSGISMALDNVFYKIMGGTAKPAYVKEKFDTLQTHVNRIESIIDHIRLFSRQQHNDTVSTVNVATVCQNAISMIRRQYMRQGISLEFSPPDAPFLVQANMYKLEQVLLNLFSNARDAILQKQRNEKLKNEGTKKQSFQRFKNASLPDNCILITLEGDADNVFIDVADAGDGVDAAIVHKIFDPFYTTKSPEQGTGLGLSISYGIIKEYDGRIQVDTKKSKGTLMRISLPRFFEQGED